MVLILKQGCEGKPKHFCPVMCLHNGYKAFTGALTGMLMDHVQRVGVLLEEQKALWKDVWMHEAARHNVIPT